MITFTKKNNKTYFSLSDTKVNFSETVSNGVTKRTLSGKAIVFNQLSDDRGGYQVRILPGSAKFTEPTLALYNHSYDNVVGNTANGTLRIVEDSEGYNVEIDLPDTQLGKDIYNLVKDRYITGMSFGTIPTKVKTVREGDKTVEEYVEMTVDEVTITVIPAFTATNIDVSEGEDNKEEATEDTEDTEEDTVDTETPDEDKVEEAQADYSQDLAIEELRYERSRLDLATL